MEKIEHLKKTGVSAACFFDGDHNELRVKPLTAALTGEQPISEPYDVNVDYIQHVS